MGQLYHREEGGGRVECNVPALYAYAICPPTFPTLRSSIANILHGHRRFDPRSPSFFRLLMGFAREEIKFRRGDQGVPLSQNSDSIRNFYNCK